MGDDEKPRLVRVLKILAVVAELVFIIISLAVDAAEKRLEND